MYSTDRPRVNPAHISDVMLDCHYDYTGFIFTVEKQLLPQSIGVFVVSSGLVIDAVQHLPRARLVPLVGIELSAAAEHANYTPPRLVEEAMKVKDILCVRQATRTPRSLLHSDLSCYKEDLMRNRPL
jgi:hypothetical protein